MSMSRINWITSKGGNFPGRRRQKAISRNVENYNPKAKEILELVLRVQSERVCDIRFCAWQLTNERVVGLWLLVRRIGAGCHGKEIESLSSLHS